MVTILSGKEVAKTIKDNLKENINSLEVKPCLACIMVGDDPASQSYVRSKIRQCNEVGINSYVEVFDNTVSEAKLIWTIEKLNKDKYINGIMVQLPLPKHINTNNILNHIDPNKDVDGFHTINQGKLVLQDISGFVPATPLGITHILDYYNINVAGKKCVILGRSNIVGKPMAQLMLQRDASVTMLHSKSKNIMVETVTADIIIVAVGKPAFIDRMMVSNNAVIIDVGINRVTAPQISKPCIIGDFDPMETLGDYEDSNISYTPVPGGVGLTTVASLLENTYKAYLKQNNLK